MTVRPILMLVWGLLALGALFQPLRGTEPPAPNAGPSEGVPVKLETADGRAIVARLSGTIRLATNFGTVELDPAKVEHITFEPSDGPTVNVSILLPDESHVYGTLLSQELALVGADGSRRTEVPGKELRGLDVERPKDLSLSAALIALVTLTFMEIVLGVDNVVFLTIIAGRLPEDQRRKARQIGLIAAAGTRLMLLFLLSWILGLTRPVFILPDLPMFHTLEARGISWRDMILLGGGLYLIYSGVTEMHDKVSQAKGEHRSHAEGSTSFTSVIVKIAIIDIVFSLDSVITAVGMADHLWVMVVAMLAAVAVMWFAAEAIGHFVEKQPTIRVLALSFLILIGVLLLAEGLGQHLNKGYIYFAMAFGIGVELINLRMRKSARDLPTPSASEPNTPSSVSS